MPEEIVLNCDSEMLAVNISEPTKLHIVSVYRPPSTPMCKFTDELLKHCFKTKRNTNMHSGRFQWRYIYDM